MTKHANRKARVRATAAKEGTNYTAALRGTSGPPPSVTSHSKPALGKAPTIVLGDTPGTPATDSLVQWRPSVGDSRMVIDATRWAASFIELVVLRAARRVGLPVLALGPDAAAYRQADPDAEIYEIGDWQGGYATLPAAASAVEAFIARPGWRLLLVHLDPPDAEDHGSRVPEPPAAGGGALDLSAEEVTGLKELRLRLAALETDPAPGLLVVGAVICPRDTELHYLFPPSYETRISPGLRLEYDQPVVFDSGLPDLERYMPGLDPALAALTSKVRSGQRAGSEAAPRSRFWWGMNPKQGRVVMGSVHGQAAVPIVLPDPPEPEPWWSPSREVLLRAGSAGN